jgi:ABC-type protease/lipase transport system fused ATPase/permease subunit
MARHWINGYVERGVTSAICPWDIELFDGTVAENIARFAADPDAERARRRRTRRQRARDMRLADG